MTKEEFLKGCPLVLAWVGEEEYAVVSYGTPVKEQYLEVVLPYREVVEVDTPAGGRPSAMRFKVLDSVRTI